MRKRPIRIVGLIGLLAVSAGATPVIMMQISGDLLSPTGAAVSGAAALKELSSMATLEAQDPSSALAGVWFNAGGGMDESSSMASALVKPSATGYLGLGSGASKAGALALSLEALLNGEGRLARSAAPLTGAVQVGGANGLFGSLEGVRWTGSGMRGSILSNWQVGLAGWTADGTGGADADGAGGSGAGSQAGAAEVIVNTMAASVSGYENYDSEMMADVLAGGARGGAGFLSGGQSGLPAGSFAGSIMPPTPPPSDVPEPATMGVIGAGLIGLALWRRRGN